MREKILYGLGVAAIVLLARDVYAIARLPNEASGGAISKLMFFQVPMVFTAMMAVVVALIASLAFLATRNFKFDALAVAVTEVGLAFLAVNLVTGSIWGRVARGMWWTWDARLTSALVCWLLYAAYLMLRRAIEEPTQRATFAAVWSIFSFIDVPIVIFSIEWWRAQHPKPAFWEIGSFPPEWYAVMGWNLLAMILFGAVMTMVRLGQEDAQRELDSLRRMAHAF